MYILYLLIITSYTTWKFLKNKEVNYRLYEQEGHNAINEVMEMTEVLGTENEESDLLNGLADTPIITSLTSNPLVNMSVAIKP